LRALSPYTTLFRSVTSGYFPLGGVFIAQKVWQPFWDENAEHIFNFGVTYAGHATACAVALKSIEIIERDQLLGRVQELERVLQESLASEIADAPHVKEYRSEGFLAMIDFEPHMNAVEFSLRLR